MFRTPTVTKNLLIVNIIAFLAMIVCKQSSFFGVPIDLNDILGLHFFLASDFHLHQLVTYMFMHANFEHLFFNMFALWMFAGVIERVWGGKRFLLYYFCCGIGAGMFQELAQFIGYFVQELDSFAMVDIQGSKMLMDDYLSLWTTVGASGAIYGILLAFGMLFPEERIFIFPLPIPVKAKWFVMFFAGVELFSALATPGDNVAHLAHLGGMVVGFFMIKYWKRYPGASFSRAKGEQFFTDMKKRWERRPNKRASQAQEEPAQRVRETDWEYNQRKKAQQDEIDRILDKIRKEGYDSLTTEEKRKLFDSGNNS